MPDWKTVAAAGVSTLPPLGNGLALAFGQLVATVTSGLEFDGSGNIRVKNGSGIAIDGTGHVTVNAGVGLAVAGGFLVPALGAGLTTSGGNIVIPGGGVTTSMLAALAVGTAQIAAGAVTSTQIASATITTANIAAAQITTALIANAAITNALLGTAVVGTANIQNAAITTALIATAAIGTAQIAALAVGNAQISDLAASKITAGTITASISITSPTITSTSGSNVASLSSGQIIVSGPSYQATLLSGTISLQQLPSFLVFANMAPGNLSIGDGAGNSAVVATTGIGFTYGSAVLQILAGVGKLNLTSMPLAINSTTVIDASRNASFAALTASGAFGCNGNTAQGKYVTGGLSGGTLAQTTSLANDLYNALKLNGIVS